MARDQVQAKVLATKSTATVEMTVKYGHKAKTCWATSQTNPTVKGHGGKGKKGKQVHVLDEQQRAGEEADKDIGGVSYALCAVRFHVVSDELENRMV